MKVIISENQHLRLYNLLVENPVISPKILSRLKTLSKNIATYNKLVSPLDDLLRRSTISVPIPNSTLLKKLRTGEEVLDNFMNLKLKPTDHVLVQKTLFKNTDDQTLIDAMAKAMVEGDDALMTTYRSNPELFIRNMESAYGKKQKDAIVKLLSSSKIIKLPSDLVTAIDDLMKTQQAKNSIQNLIGSGALQSNINQSDVLINALKSGDLSPSDITKVLLNLFKFTSDQSHVVSFAKQLAKLTEVTNKATYKDEILSAYMGLKTGQVSQYQASLTNIANKLKSDYGLKEPQAREYANWILRPKMGESFKLGFKSQGGIRPGLKYLVGPILRSFPRWRNFQRATDEEKRIFWTWLIGGPSNWPVVFRLMKEWGWLRGIPYGAANVTGQLVKKWIWIWLITSAVDIIGKMGGNFTPEEKELLNDYEGIKGLGLMVVVELLDILDPSNASFLSPAGKAAEIIARYFGVGGGLYRFEQDLNKRFQKTKSWVLDAIQRDNPDVDVVQSPFEDVPEGL
jgi:hypothetical protein